MPVAELVDHDTTLNPADGAVAIDWIIVHVADAAKEAAAMETTSVVATSVVAATAMTTSTVATSAAATLCISRTRHGRCDASDCKSS